jgi:hypothetical protein
MLIPKYYYADQIKENEVDGTCSTHGRGEERTVYKVLVGKQEGKRPLERPRRRWEDGIRIDVRETGWGSVEWIQLVRNIGTCGGLL